MEERFDTIDCERVAALAPTYVDGEVRSEATASAVRRHLIDCARCRALVQDETTLRQWFVPTEEVEVPAGFAARVARRAFAGDRGSAGEREHTLRPVAPASGALDERRRISDFAIALTAVAAAALILVTLMIASDKRADVDARRGLSAGPQLEEQLRQLEILNGAEEDARPTAAPVARDAASRAPADERGGAR